MIEPQYKICEYCGLAYPSSNRFAFCTSQCSAENYRENKGLKMRKPVGWVPVTLDDYKAIPNKTSFRLITEEYTGENYETANMLSGRDADRANGRKRISALGRIHS